MNFDEAIKAHTIWKMKLSTYINNPDKSLNYKTVCQDNVCDLGKWIYGEGSKYFSNQNFLKLKQIHGEFHREAANIIQKSDTHQDVREEVMLGSKSKFSNLSNEIVTILMQMRKFVEQK